MADTFALYRALSKFVENHLRALVTIDGVVIAYNSDNYTCDITINEVAVTGVPITVNKGNQSSIYPIPVIGTNCLVTFRDGHRQLPQIVEFDQVDSYWVTAHTKVYIKAPTIQFDDGQNGGLVLVNNLVTRMNLIENNQNLILNALKGITVASTPFPFSPIFSSIQDLTDTTANEIQSTVITQ